MTLVTKGRHRGLRFAKRQIQCSPGNSRMRCGKCGCMDFEAHVRPAPTAIVGQQTSAQIAELICLGCLKVYRLDAHGVLEATGKVDPTSLVDDYVAPTPSDIRAEQLRKVNGH